MRARADGGYRNSLTEIVQIIGRVTRDAPGKARAKFTNQVAEPMAAQSDVVEAVNDTLKVIAEPFDGAGDRATLRLHTERHGAEAGL